MVDMVTLQPLTYDDEMKKYFSFQVEEYIIDFKNIKVGVQQSFEGEPCRIEDFEMYEEFINYQPITFKYGVCF